MTLRTLIACAIITAACTAQSQTYKNPDASPSERAQDLIGRLTLEEKVSLMKHASPAVPRLGIEQYNWWNEALHGVARAGLATVFPQPIGMAATFDNALIYDVFTAASDEARAKHHAAKKAGPLKIYQGLTFWTPNINIFRDPRWGRGHETYGEDPYLTAAMGLSVVRGLQGDSFDGTRYQGPDAPKHLKAHACAKHYAVHSGPEWSRHTFNADNISSRDLWETYLPAFKALVSQGNVKEVMCAYNRVDDEPCCGNNRLLQVILRDGWGYQGIVNSDCWAVNDFLAGYHETDPDIEHATAKAVRAGTDLECGESYPALAAAVRQGLIDEATIDKSLMRLLTARFELGEMDDDSLVEWSQIPYSVVASDAHRQLAERTALETIVLLKNDGILPLSKGMKIGLIGPNANDSIMQWGNYNGFPRSTSTLLSALQQRLPEAELIFVDGLDHTSTNNIKSLFNQVKSSGQQGFDARFWNTQKLNDGQLPDAEFHYANPLQLTTAGAIVFAPGVNLGDFTMKLNGQFVPKESGPVNFSMQAMGWTKLCIDGEEVFKGGNFKNPNVYQLLAESGRTYNIELTFVATEGECATLYFDFGKPMPLDIDRAISNVLDCDAVIYAGGLSPQLEGEEMPVEIYGFRGGDREIIELPAVQTQVLEALHKAGKKIVFVNYSGSAVALPHESEISNAVVQAWYPGEAGGDAVAKVLLGEYNPAGRLPVTFYASTSELPDIEDYSMSNRTYRYFKGKPLYPFGYGLSYSTFNYGDAHAVLDGDDWVVTVPVTNTSDRAGDEVVQLYLSYPDDVDGPVQQLRAFQRVNIQPGATADVALRLSPDQFSWFNPATEDVEPRSGKYVLRYGPSSDPSTQKSLEICRNQ